MKPLEQYQHPMQLLGYCCTGQLHICRQINEVQMMLLTTKTHMFVRVANFNLSQLKTVVGYGKNPCAAAPAEDGKRQR